jgi:hypothetical protein
LKIKASVFEVAGGALLCRGFQKRDNAEMDRKMPFLDGHYLCAVASGGSMHNRIAYKLTGIVIGLLLLSSCVKQKEMAAVTPSPWRTLASGAYSVDKGRMFYGIGKASGLRSATLLRATSDNQAQSEMARVIASYLGALSHAAGYTVIEDQDQETLRALTASILRQARISDHWYDEPNATLYSLCSLELSGVRHALQRMEYLDEGYRKNMLAHVDPVFSNFSRKNVRAASSPMSHLHLLPQSVRHAAGASLNTLFASGHRLYRKASAFARNARTIKG